jgi:hypothetical protein
MRKQQNNRHDRTRIGLDLGDRWHRFCVLGESGQVVEEFFSEMVGHGCCRGYARGCVIALLSERYQVRGRINGIIPSASR